FSGATPALPFSTTELDSVDQAIETVIGRDRLLIPDDVRGNHSTLRAAVVSDGWPTMKDTAGKLMFILDSTSRDPAL
ncbi:MAG: hypothetical protein GTO41_06240, partial [Burkholderiales bacterium]|nr:hypothetical protein [Burkholderiales bacterium]